LAGSISGLVEYAKENRLPLRAVRLPEGVKGIATNANWFNANPLLEETDKNERLKVRLQVERALTYAIVTACKFTKESGRKIVSGNTVQIVLEGLGVDE
jgi:hypothetical protein